MKFFVLRNEVFLVNFCKEEVFRRCRSWTFLLSMIGRSIMVSSLKLLCILIFEVWYDWWCCLFPYFIEGCPLFTIFYCFLHFPPISISFIFFRTLVASIFISLLLLSASLFSSSHFFCSLFILFLFFCFILIFDYFLSFLLFFFWVCGCGGGRGIVFCSGGSNMEAASSRNDSCLFDSKEGAPAATVI